MSSTPNFTQAEDFIVRGMFADGHTDDEIMQAVNAEFGTGRSRISILRRRNKLGLWLKDSKVPKPKPMRTSEEATIEWERMNSDYRFKLAMLGAIESGAESAVIGVVKDRRPFAINTIQPEPTISMCSSSASWADHATDENRAPSDLY